jgi:hypothetical protein
VLSHYSVGVLCASVNGVHSSRQVHTSAWPLDWGRRWARVGVHSVPSSASPTTESTQTGGVAAPSCSCNLCVAPLTACLESTRKCTREATLEGGEGMYDTAVQRGGLVNH